MSPVVPVSAELGSLPPPLLPLAPPFLTHSRRALWGDRAEVLALAYGWDVLVRPR